LGERKGRVVARPEASSSGTHGPTAGSWRRDLDGLARSCGIETTWVGGELLVQSNKRE